MHYRSLCTRFLLKSTDSRLDGGARFGSNANVVFSCLVLQFPHGSGLVQVNLTLGYGKHRPVAAARGRRSTSNSSTYIILRSPKVHASTGLRQVVVPSVSELRNGGSLAEACCVRLCTLYIRVVSALERDSGQWNKAEALRGDVIV